MLKRPLGRRPLARRCGTGGGQRAPRGHQCLPPHDVPVGGGGGDAASAGARRRPSRSLGAPRRAARVVNPRLRPLASAVDSAPGAAGSKRNDRAAAGSAAAAGGGGDSNGSDAIDCSGSFPAYRLPAQDCLAHYGVASVDVGLTSAEATRRLVACGPNALDEGEGRAGWLKLLLAQFDDLLVRVLLAAAAVSFGLSYLKEEPELSAETAAAAASAVDAWAAYAEPLVILAILVLNAAVSVAQELSAEEALEELKELQPDRVRAVVRDGARLPDFPAANLVPGDIVDLGPGDRVPADLRIVALRTMTLRADQASLTGESEAVDKQSEPCCVEAGRIDAASDDGAIAHGASERDDVELQAKDSMLFASTVVVNGSCVAVVNATGGATELGKVQATLNLAQKEASAASTPLSRSLDAFAEDLTALILGICVLLFALNSDEFVSIGDAAQNAGAGPSSVGSVVLDGSPLSLPDVAVDLRGATYYFKIAVALAVAAIPEGLPGVVTIALSLGTRAMARQNAIVRRLASVETLGCASVICSDKTGTLTTNQMSVTTLVALGPNGAADARRYTLEGTSYDPRDGSSDADAWAQVEADATAKAYEEAKARAEAAARAETKADAVVSAATMAEASARSRSVRAARAGPARIRADAEAEAYGRAKSKAEVDATDAKAEMEAAIKAEAVARIKAESAAKANDEAKAAAKAKAKAEAVAIAEAEARAKAAAKARATAEDVVAAAAKAEAAVKARNEAEAKAGLKRRTGTEAKMAVAISNAKTKAEAAAAAAAEVEAAAIAKVEAAEAAKASGLPAPADMNANLQAIAMVCSLCNDARLSVEETPDGAGRKYRAIGQPTEAALRVLVEKMYLGTPDAALREGGAGIFGSGASVEPVNDAWGGSYSRVATLEFDRDRKSMSVLVASSADGMRLNDCEHQPLGGGGVNKLLVKGAPESVLERCTHVMRADGSTAALGADDRAALAATLEDMARGGQRTLAFAAKWGHDLGALEHYDGSTLDDTHGDDVFAQLADPTRYAEVESGLTLVGLAGLRDPPRPEVRASIESCREAGVRVIVITGDNSLTAEAICRDIGVFEDGEGLDDTRSITARSFATMSEADQLEFLSGGGGRVFSRAEPKHKQDIVRLLKSKGSVVAMTGDGVNDAPALKLADVGLAMGITGTEVAKEASDMVLADDNFATIVSAIGEGRAINANVRSVIRYLVSSNIGEVRGRLSAAIDCAGARATAVLPGWPGRPATYGYSPHCNT